MKNTLFTRRALESECRCSRRHLEEYNQHGVWCWWCQNWCLTFENHDSSPFFFPCEGYQRVRKILKSRLVSRLRFFFIFIWWCHQMTTIDSVPFFFFAKIDIDKIETIFRIFHLRLQALLTFALEFVSSPNIIFFCFFSVIRSSLVNRKAKKNPLFLWQWLSSDISSAATAEFSCFCIPEEISRMSFLVFWNGNGTVDPFLSSYYPVKKRRGLFFCLSRKQKRKNIAEAHRKNGVEVIWKCHKVF